MEKQVVLIVEDEVLVGMMLAKKIEESGFGPCEVVSTGEEALLLARQLQPAAILMDISLGGELDGIETGSMIRQEMPVPVIFFTGYSQDRELYKRAQAAEPEAIIDKLGAMEEITGVLARLFSR